MSLSGRWRRRDRPRLCDASNEASAIYTLIRQRPPTPSCGGLSPYREENSEPGRYVTESLTTNPRVREQPGSPVDHGRVRLGCRVWSGNQTSIINFQTPMAATSAIGRRADASPEVLRQQLAARSGRDLRRQLHPCHLASRSVVTKRCFGRMSDALGSGCYTQNGRSLHRGLVLSIC